MDFFVKKMHSAGGNVPKAESDDKDVQPEYVILTKNMVAAPK